MSKRLLPVTLERLERSYTFWGFRGCVVPGCEAQARLHHIVPRRKGGTNARENLLPICALHEQLIHRAGGVAEKLNKGMALEDAVKNKRERKRSISMI